MFKFLVSVFFLLTVSACSTTQDIKSAPRLLLISGDTLNVHYEGNAQANDFVREVGSNFAEVLEADLLMMGAQVVTMETHNAASYQAEFQKAIAAMTDTGDINGVTQVKVVHRKDDKVNQMAVEVHYYPTEAWLKGCGKRISNACDQITSVADEQLQRFVFLDQATGDLTSRPMSEMTREAALNVLRQD